MVVFTLPPEILMTLFAWIHLGHQMSDLQINSPATSF